MALNLLFVLVGTTGAGKTALSQMLTSRKPWLRRIRSCTTRPRRVSEGESTSAYHFLTREEFEKHVRAGHFVEYDEFDGHFYGRRYQDFTPLQDGPCIADMTELGVAALQNFPGMFRMVCIKITPIHKTALERDTARAKDDAARTRVPIRVDHEITNDHGKSDGLLVAVDELARIVDVTLPTEHSLR